MKVIRVFPVKTVATPIDELSRYDIPKQYEDEADEIHISTVFTWDMKRAEQLAKAWEGHGKVMIGGPATGMPGKGFIPGMYLKHGFVITSRGCSKKCWFCKVHKREGNIKELKIYDGWKVLDDNILACSERHIKAVFNMLEKQSEYIEFDEGGLDPTLFREWHIDLLLKIRVKTLFFSFDYMDDLESLFNAGKLLKSAGFDRMGVYLGCSILVAYESDTIKKAEQRIYMVKRAGFEPMVCIYEDDNGKHTHDKDWMRLDKQYHHLTRNQ